MTEQQHDHPRRRYQSPVREEQAKLTRQRIAAAARKLFLERGFARTSLKLVAQEARVSEQTIYTTYGSKRALVFAILDDLELEANLQQLTTEVDAADGNASRILRAFTQFDRRLFEGAGDHLRILQDAATSDPELARVYNAGRERGRQQHMREMTHWAERGMLHEDLSGEEAADLYHAISNVDSYSYLVSDRGWSSDAWERHTYRVLAAALLRREA